MQTFENFLQLPSYLSLKEMARDPIDLTDPTNLTPERLKKFVAEAAGFRLLFGTERVTDDVVAALQSLANEARVFQQMQKMQNGEVMNFIEGHQSENRAVLHTALRDFFDNPNEKKTASQAREMAKAEVEKIKNFEKKLEAFEDLVVIGIGGSELGPEALFIALKSYIKPNRRVHFVGNIDPDALNQVTKELNLTTTLVAVISKSGSTQETLINEAIIRDLYKEKGLESKNHFVAVTGEGSPLDDTSKYLACFYMWDWVGGRYSTSSAVGGIVATFAFGFQAYWDFLKGAHVMDQIALDEDIIHNLPLLGALLAIWNRNFLNATSIAIIPYSKALARLAAHIQQVQMESNGKQITRQGEAVTFETGPVFWGEPGTNAQHSFFQLLHQGTAVIPVEFIGFLESQTKRDSEQQGSTSQEKLLANLFAQSLALAVGQKSDNPNKAFPGNRPSHILLAKELTPETLGSLFAYFEHQVAFQGFIWNINSFDQEGVQLGKVLASRFVDLFKSKRGEKVKTKATPLEEAYLAQLEKLK